MNPSATTDGVGGKLNGGTNSVMNYQRGRERKIKKSQKGGKIVLVYNPDTFVLNHRERVVELYTAFVSSVSFINN